MQCNLSNNGEPKISGDCSRFLARVSGCAVSRVLVRLGAGFQKLVRVFEGYGRLVPQDEVLKDKMFIGNCICVSSVNPGKSALFLTIKLVMLIMLISL